MTTTNMTQAPRDHLAPLKAALEAARGQITSAYPRGSNRTAEFEAARDAVLGVRNIDRADPAEVVSKVLQVARAGLSLDDTYSEAYLQVRKTRDGVVYPDLQIGYRGLRRMVLAANPDLRDVYARVVYEGEVFVVEDGSAPVVRHVIDMTVSGDLWAAYAVAVWRDGARRIDVLSGDDVVRRHRDRSPGYQRAEQSGAKDSPWHTDEAAMWRKSAIVELANTLSLRASSVEAATTELPEERHEEGVD